MLILALYPPTWHIYKFIRLYKNDTAIPFGINNAYISSILLHKIGKHFAAIISFINPLKHGFRNTSWNCSAYLTPATKVTTRGREGWGSRGRGGGGLPISPAPRYSLHGFLRRSPSRAGGSWREGDATRSGFLETKFSMLRNPRTGNTCWPEFQMKLYQEMGKVDRDVYTWLVSTYR